MLLRRHRWLTVLPLLAAFVLGTPVGSPRGHECCSAPTATAVVTDAMAVAGVEIDAQKMDHVGVRSVAADVAEWAPALVATVVVSSNPRASAASSLSTAALDRGPPSAHTAKGIYLTLDKFLL